MYPKRRNKRKKILFVTAAIVLVLGAAGGGYALVKYRRNQRAAAAAQKHAEEVAAAERQEVDSTKRAIEDSTKANNDQATSDQTTQSVPTNPAAKATITKLEQAGDNVVVSATASGVSTAGKCVAQFNTALDRPVTKEVTSTVNGTTATCGPITINNLEFSYIGDWKASVTFYSGDTKVVSAERTINIK